MQNHALIQTQIASLLLPSTQSLISHWHLFDSIDSTNQYLLDYQPKTQGQICFAQMQTAGRGRRGRRWLSPLGQNIYGSILWQLPSNHWQGLSLVIGLIIVQTLTKLGWQDLGLKWPNDIIYQGKKLGGILIEVQGDYVVIGFGINIVLSDHDLSRIEQAAISLQQINPEIQIERNLLIGHLLNAILPVLANYQGFLPYQKQWQQWDAYFNQVLVLVMEEQQWQGVNLGVDGKGGLQLRCKHDNRVHSFYSGDIIQTRLLG